jgi:hypothetical protein
LTLWLSITPAVGSGSRPSAILTCRTNAPWILSMVPSAIQRYMHFDTVDHGGKS